MESGSEEGADEEEGGLEEEEGGLEEEKPLPLPRPTREGYEEAMAALSPDLRQM